MVKRGKKKKEEERKPICSHNYLGQMVLSKLIDLVNQITLAEKFFPKEKHRLEIARNKWAKHLSLLLLRCQTKPC